MHSSKLNETIAVKWFSAFNNHDLKSLIGLYDDDAKHYSPKLKIKYPETHGLIFGKEALRKWWKEAFEKNPDLRYEIKSLTSNDKRIFMEYTRIVPGEEDLYVAELLEINNGKIIYSRVYHG